MRAAWTLLCLCGIGLLAAGNFMLGGQPSGSTWLPVVMMLVTLRREAEAAS